MNLSTAVRLTLVLFLAVSAGVPGWADLTVAYTAGTAEYRGDGDTRWQPLEEGRVVPEAGYVRTGSASALELVKGTKLRLLFSANTLARVRVDQDPAKDRLLLQTGKVLSQVLGAGAAFQVRTATTVMGVRGTQFTVLADPRNGSQVAVKDGRVFTLGRTADGSVAGGVLVEAGQKALTALGAAPAALALRGTEAGYYDFSAFDGLASGRVGPLFDHYRARSDPFFQQFTERDLADFQLFILDDLDQQWEFLLSENQAWADQLRTAPLKEKP